MTVKVDARFLHNEQKDAKMLRVVDVAKITGMSLQSVRDNIRRGRFPHACKAGIEINSAFLVPECCLEKFMQVRGKLTRVVSQP